MAKLQVVDEQNFELPFDEPERAVQRPAVTPADVLKTLTQLGALVTMRLMLAVSVLGALGLAAYAIGWEPSPYKLWVLGLYCVMVVWPLVFLSKRG